MIDLRIPYGRQALLERGVDVVGGDQFFAYVFGHSKLPLFPFGDSSPRLSMLYPV